MERELLVVTLKNSIAPPSGKKENCKHLNETNIHRSNQAVQSRGTFKSHILGQVPQYTKGEYEALRGEETCTRSNRFLAPELKAEGEAPSGSLEAFQKRLQKQTCLQL